MTATGRCPVTALAREGLGMGVWDVYLAWDGSLGVYNAQGRTAQGRECGLGQFVARSWRLEGRDNIEAFFFLSRAWVEKARRTQMDQRMYNIEVSARCMCWG